MAHRPPETVSDFQYSPKSFTSNITRPKRSLSACQFWQLMEETEERGMAEFFIQVALFPFGCALSGIPIDGNKV